MLHDIGRKFKAGLKSNQQPSNMVLKRGQQVAAKQSWMMMDQHVRFVSTGL